MSYKDIVLQKSPRVYLPMDEGPEGNVYFAGSYAANHQVVENRRVAKNGYWSFDGTTDQSVRIKPSMQFGIRYALTMAVWVRFPRGVTKDQDIIRKWMFLSEDSIMDDGIGVQYNNGSPRLTIFGRLWDGDASAIFDGNWHYIGYTRAVGASQPAKVFIDGEFVGPDGPKSYGVDRTYSGDVWIGSNGEGTNFFEGDVSSVELWQRELSEHDLWHNYTEYRTGIWQVVNGVEVRLEAEGLWAGGVVEGYTRMPMPLTPARVRYFDITNTVEALDRATTIPELNAAMSDMAGTYGVTIQILTAPYTYNSQRATPPTMDKYDLRGTLKWLADEMAKYPPAFFRSLGGINGFYLADEIRDVNVPSNVSSGLAIREEKRTLLALNDYGYDPTVPGVIVGQLDFILHHEMWHLIAYVDVERDQELRDRFAAVNVRPYMSVNYINEPKRIPEGYTRRYGLFSADEDIAEFFGAIMATGYQRMITERSVQDSVFAQKVDIIKDFMYYMDFRMEHPQYFTKIHEQVNPNVREPVW